MSLTSKQLKELAGTVKVVEELLATEIEDMVNGKLPEGLGASQVSLHGAHLIIAQLVIANLQKRLTGEYQSRKAKSPIILLNN